MELMIPLFTATLVAGFGLLILIGHGDSLIAGYNTGSKQEKARYNIRRLRKVIGIGMLLVAAETLVLSLYQFDLPPALSWLWPWGLLVTIALMPLLAYTYCKKKA